MVVGQQAGWYQGSSPKVNDRPTYSLCGSYINPTSLVLSILFPLVFGNMLAFTCICPW